MTKVIAFLSAAAFAAGIILSGVAVYEYGHAQGEEAVNIMHRMTFRCGYDTLIIIDNVRDEDMERMAGTHCTLVPNK